MSGIEINLFRNGQGAEYGGNKDLIAIHFSLCCSCSRRDPPESPTRGSFRLCYGGTKVAPKCTKSTGAQTVFFRYSHLKGFIAHTSIAPNPRLGRQSCPHHCSTSAAGSCRKSCFLVSPGPVLRWTIVTDLYLLLVICAVKVMAPPAVQLRSLWDTGGCHSLIPHLLCSHL